MGTWGTGILSNDTACDIRDTYEELLRYGRTADEAEQFVCEEFGLDPNNPNKDCDAWLALAAVEWKCGKKLSVHVQEIALFLIDNPADMDAWATQSQRNRRCQELQKLKKQLCSPLPRPKRLKAFKPVFSPWKVGDVIAIKMPQSEKYPALSDQYALLHLITIRSNKVSRFAPDTLCYEIPCFALFYWWGNIDDGVHKVLQDRNYAIRSASVIEWGKPIVHSHAILQFNLFEHEMETYFRYKVISNINPPDCDKIVMDYGWGDCTTHATCSADIQRWLSKSNPIRLVN